MLLMMRQTAQQHINKPWCHTLPPEVEESVQAMEAEEEGEREVWWLELALAILYPPQIPDCTVFLLVLGHGWIGEWQ
jgi:hypothetical protein